MQLMMSRRSLLYFTHTRRMFSSVPPPIRPTDWKSAAPEPLPGSLTFSSQPSLPRLPVPDLKETLERLKESLKPIAWTDSEYSSVLGKIDAFANDQGPRLQQRLLDRASEKPHWLEEWWDNSGYLGYRDSVRLYIYSHCRHLYNIIIQVVVNVSYYCEDPRIKTYIFNSHQLGQMDSIAGLNTCLKPVLFVRQVLREEP